MNECLLRAFTGAGGKQDGRNRGLRCLCPAPASQPSGRLRRQQVVRCRPARPRQGRALDGELGRGLHHHGGRGVARLPDQSQGRGRPQHLLRLDHASVQGSPERGRHRHGAERRAEFVGDRRRRLAEGGHVGADRRPQCIEGRGADPGRRRRQAHGEGRLVQRAELRRRRRGTAVRHRERDRQAGRPSFRVDGFRRPLPRRRVGLRLWLGRALDPRRGLLEDRAARDQGRSCRRPS